MEWPGGTSRTLDEELSAVLVEEFGAHRGDLGGREDEISLQREEQRSREKGWREEPHGDGWV